jgi:hypothetical protein
MYSAYTSPIVDDDTNYLAKYQLCIHHSPHAKYSMIPLLSMVDQTLQKDYILHMKDSSTVRTDMLMCVLSTHSHNTPDDYLVKVTLLSQPDPYYVVDLHFRDNKWVISGTEEEWKVSLVMFEEPPSPPPQSSCPHWFIS